MRINSAFVTAAFALYFVTVVSLAILVASGTSGPWFDGNASVQAYSSFLTTYLLILLAIPFFGAIRRVGKGDQPPLGILIGPAIVAALFLGVASIMLPAAGGFLQTNYRMNTATILALSYSWFGLAFYAAAAFAIVLRRPTGDL